MNPQPFQWNGEAFVPVRPRFLPKLEVDRVYWLVDVKETEPPGRSWRDMMAIINKVWANLPHDYDDVYPSPTALRKRALISAGFYDETLIEVADAATGALIASVIKKRDVTSHVIVRPGCIIQRTAKSQRQMDRETFNRSKEAIFEIISEIAGYDINTLRRQK